MIFSVLLLSAALADPDVPSFDHGFGVRRNIYASGRLTAACSDMNGIFRLAWYGPELRNGRHTFMETSENTTFANIFRVDAVIDGAAYRLTYGKTRHYPFGYTSECTVGGVRLAHEFVLDGAVMFRRVRVLENPERRDVRCRVVQSGYVWTAYPDRARRPKFVFDGRRTMTAEVTDFDRKMKPEHVTRVSIGCATSDLRHPFTQLDRQVQRYYLEETTGGSEHLFFFAFDPGPREDLSSARVDRVFSSFAARMRDSVRFETGDRRLDSALAMVPPSVSALEVEQTGGFRASPFYWIWGWDSLVHAEALALCGWADEVKRMLRFYRDKAVPGQGIAHCFGPQYQVEIPLSPVVQLMYVTLLDSYVNLTGDEALKRELLPFAREIVVRAKAHIRPGEVLERGLAFYPDFPNYVGQTKDNPSLMNNGVYYQGLAAWHDLTGEGKENLDRLGREIVRVFWNGKEGYWSDSVDAETLAPREVFPSYGILHFTPYAEDPVADRLPQIAAYLKRHHRVRHGINMFEIGSKAYMADGNQYGAYYPVTDRGYWNIQNAVGAVDAIADLSRIVSDHWKTLTYPEGQTLEFANTDVVTHGDEPGNKQAFAAKAWLADMIDLRLGLRVGKDGVRFRVLGDGMPFSVRNLHLRGTLVDVTVKGRGVKEVRVPWAQLKGCRRTLSFEL